MSNQTTKSNLVKKFEKDIVPVFVKEFGIKNKMFQEWNSCDRIYKWIHFISSPISKYLIFIIYDGLGGI